MTNANSRPTVLKSATLGTAGVMIGARSSSYARILGANDRIRVAIVGPGDRASDALIRPFLRLSDELKSVPRFDLVSFSPRVSKGGTHRSRGISRPGQRH